MQRRIFDSMSHPQRKRACAECMRYAGDGAEHVEEAAALRLREELLQRLPAPDLPAPPGDAVGGRHGEQ